MKTLLRLLPLLALFLCGCASLPENATCPFERSVPIDNTRLIVRQTVDFLPSLTGFRFPAGTYIPVAKDERGGVFYRSPQGLTGLGVVVGAAYPVGGLYYRKDADGSLILKAWCYPGLMRQVYDTQYGSFSNNVRIVVTGN